MPRVWDVQEERAAPRWPLRQKWANTALSRAWGSGLETFQRHRFGELGRQGSDARAGKSGREALGEKDKREKLPTQSPNRPKSLRFPQASEAAWPTGPGPGGNR